MSPLRPGPVPVRAATGRPWAGIFHGSPGGFRERPRAESHRAWEPGSCTQPPPRAPPGRPPEPPSHVTEMVLGRKRDSRRFCVVGLDPRLLGGKTRSRPRDRWLLGEQGQRDGWLFLGARPAGDVAGGSLLVAATESRHRWVRVVDG